MNMPKKKTFPQSNLKVLGVIYELSLHGLTPSRKGIEAILHGEFDYGGFSSLLTFASLLSLRGKKLSSILRNLESKDLVEEKWIPSQDESYYLIKREGETMAKEFLSHYHKTSLGQTKPEKRKFLEISSIKEQEQITIKKEG